MLYLDCHVVVLVIYMFFHFVALLNPSEISLLSQALNDNLSPNYHVIDNALQWTRKLICSFHL